MNAKNVNEILDALAARLSVPAAHLWAVLVRQAAVEFWAQVTVTVTLVLATWLLTRHAKSRWAAWEADANTSRDTTRGDLWMIGSVVFGLLGVIASSAFVISAGLNIGRILNPEYYALQEILAALK